MASEILRPNGAGSEISIEDQVGAGAHWELVDDVVADDLATCVRIISASATWQRDLYAIQSSSVGIGNTISKVRLYVVRYINVAECQVSFKTHGTVYDYATFDEPGGWGLTYKELTTNPSSGLAWTWAEIAALEIGVRLKDNGTPAPPDYCHCTQLYLEITYTEITGTTPDVDTLIPILVTNTTARGVGFINSIGSSAVTEHGLCWDETTDPTTTDSSSGFWGKSTEGAGVKGGFYSDITGLTASKLYYIRAYAVNEWGTSYGESVSFTTGTGAPTVTTQECTNVATTTGTGNGNITDLGDTPVTAYGHCWKIGGTPTVADSHTDNFTGAVVATGAFTSAITGLTADQEYICRAYATNSGGTSYGDEVDLLPSASNVAPTVTTQACTNITSHAATGNGNITSLGIPAIVTKHGHVWSYVTDEPVLATSFSVDNGAATATGAYTSVLDYLIDGDIAYVRAFAVNQAGIAYGELVTVIGALGTPEVTPGNPLLRVSGIARTFWAGEGGNSVYQTVLTLGGMSTTYVPSIGEREPPSATTPTKPLAGEGYSVADFIKWQGSAPIDVMFKIFGHIPSYDEWVKWKAAALEQGYVSWSP